MPIGCSVPKGACYHAAAACHRHPAKSRLSIPTIIAKQKDANRRLFVLEQAMGILFCEKATAVAACHRHPAKSRLSIPAIIAKQKDANRRLFVLEQAMGIEPTTSAWEARITTDIMTYLRIFYFLSQFDRHIGIDFFTCRLYSHIGCVGVNS